MPTWVARTAFDSAQPELGGKPAITPFCWAASSCVRHPLTVEEPSPPPCRLTTRVSLSYCLSADDSFPMVGGYRAPILQM